jgi:small-conductance mechanosensitive channel
MASRSSVVIANRSAFSVGDEIEVDGLVGRFERLAKRSTVIRTRDGVRVLIPNTELMDKTVKVYTAYDERRSAVEVTVSLDTDLDVADEVIREALSHLDSVRRVGSMRTKGLGDGVGQSIRFWHGPRIVEGNDAGRRCRSRTQGRVRTRRHRTRSDVLAPHRQSAGPSAG